MRLSKGQLIWLLDDDGEGHRMYVSHASIDNPRVGDRFNGRRVVLHLIAPLETKIGKESNENGVTLFE